ncbi:MAG TPA: AraC family transcriptional regulator [Chitinophagaceae bacterium]|nr:AraC family transcriptional regulator [Chitinophagaceae bacterium]
MVNTLIFPYQQIPFDRWIREVAHFLGQKVDNNRITMPKSIGKGNLMAMSIQPGLSFALGNFRFDVDAKIQVKDNGQNGYVLYFRKLAIKDKYSFYVGPSKKEIPEDCYESAFLVSTKQDHTLEFSKGTFVMSLMIYMEEEWINNNISLQGREKLKEYVSCGICNYNKEALSAKQKKILESMLKEDAGIPLNDLFLKGRAYRMVEYFLNFVLSRSEKDIPAFISDDDMQKLMLVENKLIASYLSEFPSIAELARIALMSETKLKKMFKQVFKMGLYEYYQKNRMHHARLMLHSRKHKISEIGARLGYSNLSNFSTAFRKEFGFLPRDYKAGGKEILS